MRAYSMDLRERVLHDSDACMQAAAVAGKYRVSASWVRRLKQRRRETGEVAPRQQRYGRHPVLAPQLHTLAALIREQPDRTLAELQVALGTSAVWHDLADRETSLYCTPRALFEHRFAPTFRPPRAVGSDRSRRSTRPASSFSMKAGSIHQSPAAVLDCEPSRPRVADHAPRSVGKHTSPRCG